jgi:hypothetical protein
MSPYQYGANNPIKNIDVNGDSIWITWTYVSNGELHSTSYKYVDGKLYDANNEEYNG